MNKLDMKMVVKGLECRRYNLPDKDCEHCIYGMMMGRRWGCDFIALCEDALELLKAQERDLIRVVRCKDCGYFQANNAEEGDWSGRCTNVYVPMNGMTVDGWWFCADGERRDDDGNDHDPA